MAQVLISRPCTCNIDIDVSVLLSILGQILSIAFSPTCLGISLLRGSKKLVGLLQVFWHSFIALLLLTSKEMY